MQILYHIKLLKKLNPLLRTFGICCLLIGIQLHKLQTLTFPTGYRRMCSSTVGDTSTINGLSTQTYRRANNRGNADLLYQWITDMSEFTP